MKKLILLSLVLLTVSCTENQRARSFGGDETVKLPTNHILINCAWKQDNLWLLTKDTTTNELYFNEKSSFGLIEGSIKFVK